MNDQTKAAPAVANPNKVPSQSQIENARDELASLMHKQGKIQTRAILSSAQAKADREALEEISKKVDEKRGEFEKLVEIYTAPEKALSIPAALEAVREKMAPVVTGHGTLQTMTVAEVDNLEGRGDAARAVLGAIPGYEASTGPTAQDPEAAKAVEAVMHSIETTAANAARAVDPSLLKLSGAPAIKDQLAEVHASFRERLGPQVMHAISEDETLTYAAPSEGVRETISRMPPLDPKPGDTWRFPYEIGGNRVAGVFDKVLGWINDKGERVNAQDLTVDYWEGDRIQKAINEAIPPLPEKKQGLFAKLTGR